MSNLDIGNKITITYLNRLIMNSDQTLPSNSIDTTNYDNGVFLSAFLAGTSGGTFTFTLQESDESGSGFTNVAANKLIDPNGTGNIVLTGAPVTPFSFPRLGAFSTKRFLRFEAVSVGTAGGNVIAIISTRSAEQKPDVSGII